MISQKQSLTTKTLCVYVLIAVLIALSFSAARQSSSVEDLNHYTAIQQAGFWNVSHFQVTSDNWTGAAWIQARNGTITDPHIIENVTVDCGGAEVNGIQIDNCNDYFIVRNCTVKNCGGSGGNGIYMYSASHGIVTNNTVIDCEGWGIAITTAIEFSFNHVLGCRGIAVFFAVATPVFNNTITDGESGLFNYQCTDCVFRENIIEAMTTCGLLLQFDNFNNTYRNNTIANSVTGMYVQIRTTNCTFLGNSMRNMSNYGIEVSNDCENNTFYLNRFEDNALHAWDYNGTNWWDNGTHGNYWDDYGSLGAGYADVDDDGFGDIAQYDIPGNTDWHPLWNDGPNPPSIALITPIDNDFRHFANRTFIVRINDTNLDAMWYIIADGQAFIFTENGTFDGIAWNATYGATPDGASFSVVFHANDTAGNVVSSGLDITVNHPPVITMVVPANMARREVGDRSFQVSVEDASLDSMWYTIGTPGGQEFSFTSNSSFNQQAWDAIFNAHNDGDVIHVYFYANDTYGEVGSAAVAIVVSKPASVPASHMFILFILFGTSALVATTLRKIRFGTNARS